MPRGEREFIDMSVPAQELSIQVMRLRSTGDGGSRTSKAIQRLGFVQLRYQGFRVAEAAKAVGVSVQTGYNWQSAWNVSGMESIYPNYAGGRSPRLTGEQRELLRDQVSEGAMTTAEAAEHILSEFGIEYSEKQVHIILASLGLEHRSLKDMGVPSDDGRCRKGRMGWVRPTSGPVQGFNQK